MKDFQICSLYINRKTVYSCKADEKTIANTSVNVKLDDTSMLQFAETPYSSSRKAA